LVFIITALCITAEITTVAGYNPILDACSTSLPLKIMVICYALVCASYVVVLAILSCLNNRDQLENVMVPLRTIALLGLCILFAMMLINLLNLTVYPIGRLAACTLVVVLYVSANTTFYIRVLSDILHNKNELVIASEMELEDFGRVLDAQDQEPVCLSIKDIDDSVISQMVSDTRSFYINNTAFTQDNLVKLVQVITCASLHNFSIEPDEDEEDFIVTRNDNHMITVACQKIAWLIILLKQLATQADDAQRMNCYQSIIEQHFSALNQHTIPLPLSLVELIAGPYSTDTARLFQDTAYTVVLIFVDIYKLTPKVK